MKNPYRERDQNIKRRLEEWKKSNQKTRCPDPGKYIKI